MGTLLDTKAITELFILLGVVILLAAAMWVGLAYLIAGVKGIKILGLIVAGLIGLGVFCEIVKGVADLTADVIYVNEYKHKHPLIYYARRCNVKKVEKYLKKGFDPNDIEENRSPLIECFYYPNQLEKKNPELNEKSDKIVELLLDYGADPNLNAGNYYPSTSAISWQREKAFKKMIEHGLVIDSINVEKAKQDGVNLKTASLDEYGYPAKPMQVAISSWSINFLKILLENKAQGTIWFDDEYNKSKTLIMKAASFFYKNPSERIQVLDMLLKDSEERGIDILNRKDKNGYTALHLLCRQYDYDLCTGVSQRENNAAICDWLIKNGADVSVVDNKNRTALHYASDYTQPEEVYSLVKVLVENGADVTMKDKSGKTALDLFVSNADEYNSKEEYYPLVIELLTSKANVVFKESDEILLKSKVRIAKAEASKEKIDSSAHLMLEDPSDNW